MLRKDREKYEKFYDAFGRQLKFVVYNDFGQNKETLQDLLLFYSSTEEKLTSLEEYVVRMKEDQDTIYYATGETSAKIKQSPKTEMIQDKRFEILYLTDDIDEFAIKMLADYDGNSFKSVSSGDLDFKDDEADDIEVTEDEQKVFDKMKEILSGKVTDVRRSKRLKSHPVVLTNDE